MCAVSALLSLAEPFLQPTSSIRGGRKLPPESQVSAGKRDTVHVFLLYLFISSFEISFWMTTWYDPVLFLALGIRRRTRQTKPPPRGTCCPPTVHCVTIFAVVYLSFHETELPQKSQHRLWSQMALDLTPARGPWANEHSSLCLGFPTCETG